MYRFAWGLILSAEFLCLSCGPLRTAEPAATPAAADNTTPTVQPAEKPSAITVEGLKRLDPTCDVWIDAKGKRVIMEGEVCLREGLLELFACMRGYKEHESIVRVNTKAYVVHAGLLAVGAKAGSPVQFRPKFKPATGTVIDIDMYWTDDKGGKQKMRAQDWIRDVKTKQAMTYPWVFAGSHFWRDQDGQEHYAAEGGDFITVSNFPGSLLDLPVESTDSNDDLLFECFSDRIPARLTKVTLVLTPRTDAKPAEGKPADAAPPSKEAQPPEKSTSPTK